jgi:hypothetical protein
MISLTSHSSGSRGHASNKQLARKCPPTSHLISVAYVTFPACARRMNAEEGSRCALPRTSRRAPDKAERIGLRDRSTFGLRRSQVPRRLRNTRTDRALARAPPTPQQHPRHQPWLMKRSSSFVFELLFVPAESMLESCRVHPPLAALVRSQLDTCAAPSSDLRWNVYTPEPCSTLIVSPLPRRRLPIRW